MVQLTDVVQANADILTSEINNELVMMDIENGQYYAMDAIGSTIWQQLKQPCQVAVLCQQLGALYDAPADTIESDVLELLEQMLARQVISLKP